jgi:hypothetical protein
MIISQEKASKIKSEMPKVFFKNGNRNVIPRVMYQQKEEDV